MFGSSPFGQSNTSPFGTQSVFGQNNNANNNPFAPKPFGSPTTPFGAQTGGSLFGGTSTGVFGATQSSSPLGSTPVFGANSSPAFGASSTPAFGTTAFGQKPAFSGFGTNNTQTAPFGGTFQPTQSAFGTNNNMFGSTTPSPFNAQSQPAFGTQQSQSAFGTTNTSPFGTTNTPNFGNTGSGFGVSAPFGVTSTTPNFGATTSGFGVSASVPAFGTATTSAFGTTTSAFGNTSSTPGFNTSSSAPFSFGQTSSAFNSSPFGTTTPSPSPFGAPTTPFGTQQPTTPSFGNTTFGQQSTFNNGPRVGSRVTPYTPTPDQDSNGTQPAGKLESISAMPAYKDKSHEELRWEDYQAGDKGGPNPAGQTTNTTPSFGNGGFNTTSTTAFGQTQTQTAANPFSTTANNPFAAKTPTFNTGFGSNTTPTISTSTFGAIPSPSPFATQPVTSSPFGTPQTSQPFGNNNSPSIFGSSSASGFGTNTSLFGSTSAQVSTPTFGQTGGFGQTMSSPLFQSTPLIGQNTNTGFGQNSTGFGQNSTGFGQNSTGFGQNSTGFGQTTSTFGQNNMFSTPNTGFNTNLFSSAQSNGFGQTTPSLSTPFQQSQPAQTGGAFGTFSTFGNTQIGANNTSGFGNTSNMFGQNTFGQQTANPSQSQAVAPPVQITNPFGTLPAMPQMSIGRTGTSPSIQYGISNLPVVDKPNPVRISSLLTSRHLSQRRIRLPARKYNPKSDGPKVAFFSDEEETPSNPKADALFIPRENPRALVIRPLDQWPAKASAEKSAPLNHTPSPGHENGNGSEAVPNPTMNGSRSEDKDTEGSNDNGVAGKKNPKQNGTHEAGPQKGDSYITLTGHRAGEAAIVYEHGADIEALMPKLRHSDYYTEPRIQELAAKERAEPGFCRRVKDFIVGRNGYGSIKFIGETDVRRLDLETLIQFNNREVIVYMDESKKPPIGQGLNKRAEVTLLNIKCIDKRSGEQYTEGPRIEKYKEMLKKKANDQGAEFLLYDPVKGEWKFRVEHFSCYKLEDEGLNV